MRRMNLANIEIEEHVPRDEYIKASDSGAQCSMAQNAHGIR